MVTKSGSSSRSTPPGRSAATIRRSACRLSGSHSVNQQRVHKIEPGRQVFGGDVVSQHLQGRIASRLGLKEVRLQIGCDDLAVGGDVLREPQRDRAATRADLDTPAARPDTEASKVRAGPVVERALQTREPDPLLGPRVVVRVTAPTHGLLSCSAGSSRATGSANASSRRFPAFAALARRAEGLVTVTRPRRRPGLRPWPTNPHREPRRARPRASRRTRGPSAPSPP